MNFLLQAAPPSSTFFTVSPDWGWYIVLYFFLGGIAGGAAFLSGLLDLFGHRLDRNMIRVGYGIAFVAIIIGVPLLIVDLTQPTRFWHMVWKSDSGGPMFKAYSAISIGIWIVSLFVVLVALASAAALADRGRLPRAFAVFGEGTLGKIIALGCVIMGSALAGYTGLVLTDTNRPLWSDTIWITLLFLLSGISAGGAAMILVGWKESHPGSIRWLEQMEGVSSVVELVVLAIIATSIWSIVSVVWSGTWAVVLGIGVVLLGVVAPLFLYTRPRTLGAATIPVAAALVLLGSFLLRTAVILSSEGVTWPG